MGLVAKAFQDIITFSRASSGTYVNSNGYITNSSVLNYLTYSNQPENAAWTKSNSFVQQNLLLYSEQFDNAAWTKQNITVTADSTISPFGTLTADTITAAGGLISLIAQSAGTTVASSPYAQSIYAKAGSKTVIQADFNAAGWGTDARANFDLANGVLGTVDAGITATIESLGNGWYRCSASRTKTPTTGNLIWCMVDSTTSAREAVCTAGTLYIFGAQLVQGSVPGDYRATTSAALPCLYADYNGALRARKLCEDNAVGVAHRIFQGPSTTTTSSLSIVAKAAERSWVYLRFIDASSTVKNGWFNLATGTVGTIESGMTGTIVSAGNGYYRCTFTGPALAGVNTTLVGVANADATAAYNGDGSSGIYIADAQLNDGSSALAYYDTTASAYNAPRFDYDPVTLAAKGLLVEESRANLLLQSNDFATTWTPISVTITQNSTLSPDGTVNADTIAASATGVGSRVQQDVVVSTTSQYVYSCYVRPGTVNTVSLSLYNNTTATALATINFNVSTGVVVTTTVGSGTITPAGNGWYRCSITHSGTVTATNSVRSYVYPNNTNANTGDSVIVFGAQLEAGAFATSYIPTVASQVTRAADVASVNTLSPWFNSVAGTLYVESIANATSPSNQYLATINDGTTNNRVTLFKATGGTANSRFTSGGVAANPTAPATSIAGITSKVALTYSTAASGVNIYVNGTAGTAVTAAATPTGMLRLALGIDETNSTSFINAHLRRVTYYPRQMTSAEGVALTTL